MIFESHSTTEHAIIWKLCFVCSLRIAGLRGLQGVVRKTVTDDLQCNIWKPTHMDKIVPSLLFNMQDAG